MRVFRIIPYVLYLCLLSCQDGLKLQEVEDVCTKMDDIKFMEFCYKSYDVNKDSKVSMSEAAAVKEIELGNGISSLKGIEYFTSLTKLSCINTQISSLDVSSNLALTNLIINKNTNLSSLNLAKNSQLSRIDCSKNSLNSLVLPHSASLAYLNCEENWQLTSLDLSKNTGLTSLNCCRNKLSSLDVSKNKDITNLNCAYNDISSLDVSRNAKLTNLKCYGNNLTSLDLSNNQELRNISCFENQLTSLNIAKTAIIRIDNLILESINDMFSKQDLTLFVNSVQYESFLNNYSTGSETDKLDIVYNKFRIIIKEV